MTPEYDCCKIVPWLKEVGRDGETVTLVVARNSILTDKEKSWSSGLPEDERYLHEYQTTQIVSLQSCISIFTTGVVEHLSSL